MRCRATCTGDFSELLRARRGRVAACAAQVTVPTPETCSVTFWMQLLVKMRKPVMMAGPAGTGKTQVRLETSSCSTRQFWQHFLKTPCPTYNMKCAPELTGYETCSVNQCKSVGMSTFAGIIAQLLRSTTLKRETKTIPSDWYRGCRPNRFQSVNIWSIASTKWTSIQHRSCDTSRTSPSE